ncbi:uncharacterized protein LOC122372686 [Amphibalanus amphitrite]|uniref:uncharacterized protein LOC122372686 n=1 Tax=Amphibalanus amphitrite TaxID=1232801 RepID=UPI001C8FD558|nr:uncharacterized protein LOC122372686 [Amphibalanus amphitrite]XP_043206132.1 uncharacterized protein LOC122372686 [Amphibalanus amphitrite]XP_043206133.1 uncharacterized protein LOC122372686 [Amphibalanus amphitrite]
MLLRRFTPCARLVYHSHKNRVSKDIQRSILLVGTLDYNAVRTASSHTVHPFGKFVFEGPGSVNVAPVSPQESPNMDKCTISCDGDGTGWSVIASEDTCSVTSNSKEKTSDTWNVHLPIKYDVEVRSAAAVSVSGMECSRAAVNASEDVTLTAVRAGHVTISTPAAVRVNKLLLGNATLEAEEVDSSAARLQGQTVAVSARSRCHLSDIYADRARLEVRSADLRVGTIHGDATVTAAGEGEVVIGGVDGSVSVSAPAAAVRCHISRLSADSRLSCGRSVQLSLAPGVGCRLQVRGPPPELDPRLGTASAGAGGTAEVAVAGGGPLLLLESPVAARVTLQDWAAAVAGWAR